MQLLIISVVMLTSNLFASSAYIGNCNLHYDLLRTIAQVEKHPKRDVGYPFLISFNSQDEQTTNLLKKFQFIRLDRRTIDCKNQTNCTNIVKTLIKNNKKNIDLGAFQICYRFHKMNNIKEYFSLKQSYLKACSILEHLIKRKGYSWDTISMYHSYTTKHKQKYLKLISNAGVKK